MGLAHGPCRHACRDVRFGDLRRSVDVRSKSSEPSERSARTSDLQPERQMDGLKADVLAHIQGELTEGRCVPSNVALVSPFGGKRSTMSDGLIDFERAGLIPASSDGWTMQGHCCSVTDDSRSGGLRLLGSSLPGNDRNANFQSLPKSQFHKRCQHVMMACLSYWSLCNVSSRMPCLAFGE